MSLDEANELVDKFLEACTDLGDEARAEGSHGNGIEEDEDRAEFIKFFEEKLQAVSTALNKIRKIESIEE